MSTTLDLAPTGASAGHSALYKQSSQNGVQPATPVIMNNHGLNQASQSQVVGGLADWGYRAPSTASDDNEYSDPDSQSLIITKPVARKRVTFDEGRNTIYESSNTAHEMPEVEDLPLGESSDTSRSSTSARPRVEVPLTDGSSAFGDFGWEY
ncbi:hypothetical protein FRB95_001536 [Tulasnella sp. JGI-2019a]|nr:hypothetical protein FRB95_001536 [Tulasnella sp. JGI-2019a]